MTRLCVAIFVTDLDKAQRDIAVAAEQGADMVELRIDEFTDPQQIRQLVSRSSLPAVVTCRPVWEGGRSELPDEQRIATLDAATAGHASYVDVELKTLGRISSDLPWSQLIASSHDFVGRPEKLHGILLEMGSTPASIHKIVWTARSIRDNLEAFEILLNRQKPTIALCMGEAGLISRILAKKFGAFLTFAALDGSGGTASGQIPVADMKRLYRWDAIQRDTKVYGVVAQPVAHSMSPAIHNAAFAAAGHNGIYLPLLVEGSYESFKAFMETFIAFEPLHLSGLSITIPHKQNALRYLQSKGAGIEPLAESIGAVNTITIERDGANVRLTGRNTDYAAILDSITAKLGIAREQLAGYRVAVIGAGGTGRTAVAALAHYGATVVIYNRTMDRAEALASEFNGRSGKVVAARMEKLCDSCCQVYLNTTSVGMHPDVDATPFGDDPPPFTAGTLVFDAIYNPMQTRLLRQAEAAGARTIGGVEMFVRQAVAQFETWTGQAAPVEVMRQVVIDRLHAS